MRIAFSFEWVRSDKNTWCTYLSKAAMAACSQHTCVCCFNKPLQAFFAEHSPLTVERDFVGHKTSGAGIQIKWRKADHFIKISRLSLRDEFQLFLLASAIKVVYILPASQSRSLPQILTILPKWWKLSVKSWFKNFARSSLAAKKSVRVVEDRNKNR